MRLFGAAGSSQVGLLQCRGYLLIVTLLLVVADLCKQALISIYVLQCGYCVVAVWGAAVLWLQRSVMNNTRSGLRYGIKGVLQLQPPLFLGVAHVQFSAGHVSE